MRKVEVKKLFLDHLKEIFVPKGYKAITAKNFFVRKTNTGFHEYYFEIIDYYDSQKIGDGFGLRIDAVEHMLKAGLVSVFPDWDKKNDSTTVRLDYGSVKLGDIVYYYPYINNLEEAMAVLETIKTYMVEEGFALLEQYNDIRFIDQDLNTPEKIDTPPPFYFFRLGPFPDYRYRQIIIARLCHNPIYDYLLEKTSKSIVKYGETPDAIRNRSALNSLIAYLDSDEGRAQLEAARIQLLS